LTFRKSKLDNMNLNENNKKENTIDVVMLMAGEGRRLLPLTVDRPKALLCCKNNISIFEHIIRAFVAQGSNVLFVPVIGHGKLKVTEEFSKLKNLTRIHCVYNPFYLRSGPLVSFWLGLTQSKNDKVIVLNGDTIIKKHLVERIHQWFSANTEKAELKIGICVTRSDNINDDDMKILLNNDQSIAKVGKDLPVGNNIVKSAGVLCLHNSLSKNALIDKLDELLMNDKALGKKYYWHNILNEVNGYFDVDLIEVDECSWIEVDTKIDLSVIT
jgi:choline kinase